MEKDGLEQGEIGKVNWVKELKAEIFRHWHDLFNEVIDEEPSESETEAVEN